jgi:hypothetical protein
LKKQNGVTTSPLHRRRTSCWDAWHHRNHARCGAVQHTFWEIATTDWRSVRL